MMNCYIISLTYVFTTEFSIGQIIYIKQEEYMTREGTLGDARIDLMYFRRLAIKDAFIVLPDRKGFIAEKNLTVIHNWSGYVAQRYHIKGL